MNSVSDYKINYDVNLIIQNTGHVSYMPPLLIKSVCMLDLTLFPFDEQKCFLKFQSWSANEKVIDLKNIENDNSLSYYTINGEWDLLSKYSFLLLIILINYNLFT